MKPLCKLEAGPKAPPHYDVKMGADGDRPICLLPGDILLERSANALGGPANGIQVGSPGPPPQLSMGPS